MQVMLLASKDPEHLIASTSALIVDFTVLVRGVVDNVGTIAKPARTSVPIMLLQTKPVPEAPMEDVPLVLQSLVHS